MQTAYVSRVRVPCDLPLIGFDDLPIATMVHPPLSTIRHPRREVAARAFELLSKTIRGEPLPDDSPLQPHLIIRNSTAPPPSVKRR